MSIITIKNLRKTFRTEIKPSGFKNRLKGIFHPQYKEIEAVCGINLSVEAGEKIAFIGPNGAGKTTTIKMLSGILHPTSGHIEVLGLNPQKDREKLVYKIGAVYGQISRLWYHLSARDTFELFGHLFDIPDAVLRQRLDELIEKFAIGDIVKKPVRKLSLGQRMRCEIVASLIHSPRIVFLDEPTIGLDIVAKSELRKLINDINATENTTIFLTSHDIDDVEQICDRAIIINHGTILYDGTIEALKRQYITHKIIKIRFSREVDFLPSDGMEVVFSENGYRELKISNDATILKTTIATLMDTYPVEDITISEPSLEEIIKTFY